MAELEIADLFDTERCSRTRDLIPLFFYFPLGLALALVRFFIGLHTFLVACVLPKQSLFRCMVLRGMCSVLGIIVREEATENRDKNCKVLITNHVTFFDHLAVDLVIPCILPGVWDLPKFLNWMLSFKDMGVKQGREVLIRNVKKHLEESDLPVLTHPEGATTNGKVGLLKFSTWPFMLEHPVQPVVIQVKRPPVSNIAPAVLGGRWWSDFFWFLFVPFTMFTLRYLPVMKKEQNETVDIFAKRAQRTIADAMGLQPTHFNCADKVEYAKRVLKVPTAPSPSHPGPSGVRQMLSTPPIVDLNQMGRHVKEVLPQVPLEAILQDLAITKCIDATISRILEGVVPYVPEEAETAARQEAVADQGDGTTSVKTLSNSDSDRALQQLGSGQAIPILNTAAKTFGKTAKERMLSYQERKIMLIENARLRYMQKKGMM